jgi:3-hydroxymyristoyl/3-hydroxydecanoyl-(acyl carrier protein) dehydratase
MDPHFAAFSFVDRIVEWTPAKRARGTFAIPAHVASFPSPLVAEATGQLAAWVAMEHIGFRGRPVAALASQTRFHHEAQPGDALDIEVEVEECDDEAVAYHGHASANGRVLVELIDCLGPMLPAADFDDPAAMRRWLGVLRGEGAAPGRFGGVTLPALEPIANEPGRFASARLRVPRDAPFFADHFPRRPVFPATLLLCAQIDLARPLARETGRSLVPSGMQRVKVRSFTAPGDVLTLTAEIVKSSDEGIEVALGALNEDRSVASARLTFAPGEE